MSTIRRRRGVLSVCVRYVYVHTYIAAVPYGTSLTRGPPKNIKKNDEKLVRKIFLFSFRLNDAQRCLMFVCVSGANVSGAGTY